MATLSLRRVGLVGLALSATALMGACGSGDDDGATAASSTPPARAGLALDGPTWLLDDGSLAVALDGADVTARFAGGALSGTSGCNEYHTSYTSTPPTLSISPNIATTQKACGPAATAVERAYLARLADVASYLVVGDALSLAAKDGRTLLAYHAADSAAALRGQWLVTSYYTGDAVSSVVGGAELTLVFDIDAVSGNAGCNSFHGPYTVDGERIGFGPLAATAKACTDPALDEQERDVLAALQLATSFQVVGDRLDLFRPGRTYAVTAVRPSAS